MNNILRVLMYLEDFNYVSIILRLILASVLGSCIGMERGATRHAAGLRTFALVCTGAALAQIIDMKCVMDYGSGDPVRLAQGVISGMGFLGVGTIVVTGKSHIKGLTTAATLWTTAILGISIGAGYLYVSLFTFALIMFVVKVMAKYSRYQLHNNREIELLVEVRDRDGVKALINYVRNKGYKIESVEKKAEAGAINVDIEIDLGKRMDHDAIVEEVGKISEIVFVEEIF